MTQISIVAICSVIFYCLHKLIVYFVMYILLFESKYANSYKTFLYISYIIIFILFMVKGRVYKLFSIFSAVSPNVLSTALNVNLFRRPKSMCTKCIHLYNLVRYGFITLDFGSCKLLSTKKVY